MSNGFNDYWRQLSDQDILEKKHRQFVGGLWQELGQLQFEFMRNQGLLPHHRLVDVGCGALRSGLHFINYLNVGNYFGIDINASLIRAGRMEVEEAGLTGKKPNLVVNGQFDLSQFGVTFDYALSVSVFTHLPMNMIIRCLVEVRKVLSPGGRYFSTFFEAPAPTYLSPLSHNPGGLTTHYDTNPYHYSLREFEWMAEQAGLAVELIGAWNHPRDQRMLVFLGTA